MKKTLLLLSVCLVFGTAVKGQDWSYGLKGGMNLANLTDDGNQKTKVSFNLGAFAEYKVSYILGIQPEFVYSRQGNFQKAGDVKAWSRYNYINVPILAKLYVFDNLSVNLGPQLGFLMNSKAKWKYDGYTETHKISGSKGFDFSFAMGLAYSLNYNWIIDARYNLGLTDVHKDADAKNSVFQIGVGYRF